MSAAATAAGYLYASGRLRGRAQREQEEGHNEPTAPESRPQHPPPPFERRRAERPPIERPRVAQAGPEVRVAAVPPKEEKPGRRCVIQYRPRRWKPDE